MMKSLILVFLLLWSCNAGTGSTNEKNVRYPQEIKWKTLLKGLYYAEIDNPFHSKISDNIISLVKINPACFDMDVYSCTTYDSLPRKVSEWSKQFNLNVVINAGMYSLSNGIIAQGFMKSKNTCNNVVFKEGYRALAVFNPMDTLLPLFDIVDMEQEAYDRILKQYQTAFQSIRMIDHKGKQIVWKPKRLIYSSMCVLAVDDCHQIILVFSRSPLSANQMSELLLNIPLKVQSAMYLEGGPECNLYIRTADTLILKIGSYVSTTFPTDTNSRAWHLPNVIGFKAKSP